MRTHRSQLSLGTRMRSLLLALALSGGLIAFIDLAGSDKRDPVELTTTSAAEYRDQLDTGLSRSDLTAEQAGCVSDAVLSAWPPQQLEDAKEFREYVDYFSGADDLAFTEHVLRFDAGDQLYDMFASCDVDLRARALAQATTFSNGTDQKCVRSTATPAGIRDHWRNHFLGLQTSKSAFQLIIESGCQKAYEDFPDEDGHRPATPSSPDENKDDWQWDGTDGSTDDGSGDSFCSEQHDLIWQEWREGQLSETDFELQLQEIEDACIGF
jgi:hypothetical protein